MGVSVLAGCPHAWLHLARTPELLVLSSSSAEPRHTEDRSNIARSPQRTLLSAKLHRHVPAIEGVEQLTGKVAVRQLRLPPDPAPSRTGRRGVSHSPNGPPEHVFRQGT